MLATVSQALRGFLHAATTPPSPEARPDDWVQIGDLSEATAREHSDCMILSLYGFEPDPHAQSFDKDSGHRPSQRPLALSLHYTLRYPSRSHEHCLHALDLVLQAFHSQPRIEVASYLPAELKEPVQGTMARALRVELETPDAGVLDTLWGKTQRALPLAAYYRATTSLIPNWDAAPGPVVERIPPTKLDATDPRGERP